MKIIDQSHKKGGATSKVQELTRNDPVRAASDAGVEDDLALLDISNSCSKSKPDPKATSESEIKSRFKSKSESEPTSNDKPHLSPPSSNTDNDASFALALHKQQEEHQHQAADQKQQNPTGSGITNHLTRMTELLDQARNARTKHADLCIAFSQQKIDVPEGREECWVHIAETRKEHKGLMDELGMMEGSVRLEMASKLEMQVEMAKNKGRETDEGGEEGEEGEDEDEDKEANDEEVAWLTMLLDAIEEERGEALMDWSEMVNQSV